MEFVDGGWCRGMLAGTGSGATGAPHAYGDGTRGGTSAAGRGMSGRAPDAGFDDDVGTSHGRGRRGRREEEGGSGSDGG